MADDDVPLAALAAKAPAKAAKLDDDTPLASLAKPGQAAGKKPGAGTTPPKGRTSVGAKAKPKAAPGKRKAGSSSSSSSSDTSSSSSGGGKKPTMAQKKALLLKKRQSEAGEGGEEEMDNKIKKKNRTIKEDVVAQLLCRWWFSAPYVANDWPPQDEEWYLKELEKKKLRKVTIQEWEWLPEEDEKGHKKVYELKQFRGMFRNSAGNLIDMRPKETCPCFNNFMAKDMVVLCDMLLSAYENQLKELYAHSKYNVDQVAATIKAAMTKIRDLQTKARENRH